MELKSNSPTSQKYHDIFDFKLTKEELIKWQYKKEKVSITGITSIKSRKRLQKEKYSKKKLVIAKRAAKLIAKIPTVKFVGITGSLAMMNANKNSDIDLMIITKTNSLWMTRIICYMVIWLNGYKTRKPKNRFEKDRLCLNLWLDESDLIWDKKDRNIYTAHEIAQVVPLINKDKIYEKFLYLNRWVLNFWPNSVIILNYELRITNYAKNPLYIIHNTLFTFVEYLVYKMQYWYMKSKISREVVTPTRAIFHPNDWGSVVLKKLSNK